MVFALAVTVVLNELIQYFTALVTVILTIILTMTFHTIKNFVQLRPITSFGRCKVCRVISHEILSEITQNSQNASCFFCLLFLKSRKNECYTAAFTNVRIL